MSEQKTPQKAAPIVKWAGGKRQLESQILEVIEPIFNRETATYFEPFFGGGAIFYALEPKRAYISDINSGLINLYNDVKANLDGLKSELLKFEVFYNQLPSLDEKSNMYYVNREVFNTQERVGIEQSARFIFLNKAGFNGLYRENSKGGYNIPFGKRMSLKLSSDSNLDSVSELLASVDVQCSSYEAIEGLAKAGDLVYLDPPYLPLFESSFTSYHKSGFGYSDQVALSDLCKRLVAAGVHVVVSNSSNEKLNDLYKGFNIRELEASRAISASVAGRAKVQEFLITSF